MEGRPPQNRSQSPPLGEEQRAKRHFAHTRDAPAIAAHYSNRPDLGRVGRQATPIRRLRAFNNWVKAVLMERFVRAGDQAMDLACGKGGDLHKWRERRVKSVTAIDIAEGSIEDARRRLTEMHDVAFRGSFEKHLENYQGRYDVVSCQFAFHYAFESEESARLAMRNVAESLRIGGFFFGTTINGNILRERLAETGKCGNSLYSAKLLGTAEKEQDDITNPIGFHQYGVRYSFSLESAVDECPEYLIPRGELIKLAGECGLRPVQIINFPEFYMRYRERPAYERLLSRMGVVGNRGEFLTDEEQEVAELYLVFAFEKVSEPIKKEEKAQKEKIPSIEKDEKPSELSANSEG